MPALLGVPLVLALLVPPPGARPATPRDATEATEGEAGSDASATTPAEAGTDDAAAAGPAEAEAGTGDAAEAEPAPSRRAAGRRRGALGGGGRGLSWSRADDPVPERRFMLGVEGVAIQAPPLRPEVVRFDPRFLGRSVSLAGLGLMGRLQLHPRIGVEAGVRSGSVRYAGREDEDGPVVSQDQVMADVGVLLYVARGDIAQLAFDAGIGGMGTRVDYELGREGRQLFGSGLVRVGADVEFLTKRIAFVVSVRSVGVFTDRDRVRQRGAALAGRDPRAPVPALQTLLVLAAGVAYRF